MYKLGCGRQLENLLKYVSTQDAEIFRVIYYLGASVAMKNVTSLSNSLLTFCKDCGLPSHLVKPSNDLFTPVHESIQRIRYSYFRTKLLNQFLSPAEVVPRHPREEMMNDLELQAPMEKVKPLGTIDIHRRS